MANEKKPSIYVDRGSIGSSDELDEYGVWVKSAPQDLPPAATETGEIPDIPADFSGENLDEAFAESSGMDDLDLSIPDMEVEDDFELPDIDTDEETSGINSDEDILALAEDGDFVEVSMEDFIVPLDVNPDEMLSGAALLPDPIPEEPAESGFEPETPVEQEAAAPEAPASPLSTQLLMKIAEELASIRGELSELKKEFSTAAIAPVPTAKDKEEESAFFDAEEDEKIALTGDELNNILNTADFVEEAETDSNADSNAADMDIAPEADISADIDISSDIDISGEDFDLSADLEASVLPGDETSEPVELSGEFLDLTEPLDSPEELPEITEPLDSADDLPDITESLGSVDDLPDITESLGSPDDLVEITESFDSNDQMPEIAEPFEALDSAAIDISPDEENLPDFSDDEAGELKEILENGVEPMTSAPDPEDADYLMEDSEEPLDLSGAVIDEPDLSSEITEAPLEEPSLEDISIDLDMEDISIPEDAFTEEAEDAPAEDEIDLSLDIPEDEPAADSLIPEAFDAEAAETNSVEPDPFDLDTLDAGGIEFSDASITAEKDEPLSVEDIDTVEETAELDATPPFENEADFAEGMEFPEETALLEDIPPFEEEVPPAEDMLLSDDLPPFEEEVPPAEDMLLSDDLPLLEEVPSAEDTLLSDDLPPLEEEIGLAEDVPLAEALGFPAEDSEAQPGEIPTTLKKELRTVLSYMDQLLESLPDDKIEEFAQSEHYDTYKKLFKELGLV